MPNSCYATCTRLNCPRDGLRSALGSSDDPLPASTKVSRSAFAEW